MTDSNATGPVSIVPQDKSGGIFRGLFGLSADEAVLVVGLPLGAAAAAVRYGGFGIGDVLTKTVVAVVVLGLAVREIDHDFTPYALAMREGRRVRDRLRMPLLPGNARRETGVRATHTSEEYGLAYAERLDGTLVAIVGGEPRNTTRDHADEWAGTASELAHTFDAKLGKADADTQFQVSRGHAEGADVATLDARSTDDDAPRDGRTAAAAVAEHTRDRERSAGVMDTTPRAVVTASASEAADTRRGGFNRGVFAQSSGTTDAQLRLLAKRADAATETLRTVADDVHTYDEREIREALRAAWRPHDEPLPDETTETAADETVLWGPHGVDEHRTHVELSPEDDAARDVVSSVWVSGWPIGPRPGILAPVLSTPGVRLEFALHPGARDRHTKADELDSQITNIKRRVGSILADRGVTGEGQARDGDRLAGSKVDLRDHAQETETEIAEVSTVLTVRARSEEVALDARDKVISRLRGVGCTATPADGDQLRAFRTATPIGRDDLRDALASRLGELLSSAVKNAHVELGTPTAFDMPSGSVGCLAPTAPSVRQDDDGVIYGLAAAAHPFPENSEETAAGLLQVCREDLSAPHTYRMGRSGAGKTYMESAQVTEEYLRERGADRVMILDIAENFDGVVRTLDGDKVVFGESLVNPWAVGPEEGVDLITELISVVLRDAEGATPPRAKVRESVRETYQREGDRDRPPVFGDYFDLLAEIQDGEADISVRSTEGEAEEWADDATALLGHLSQFRPGGEFGFMSPDLAAGDPPEGSVDLSERVLLFDGSEFQDRGGPAKGMLSVLFLSLAYRASAGDDMTLCVVDEAHSVFKSSAQAGRFESMVRAGRNRGLCFDFLSQADEDFNMAEARVIAKQASLVVAGNVGTEAEPGELMSFGFPREEAEEICGELKMGRDGDYSEAVVSVEGDIYLTQYQTHPLVADLITYSDPDPDDPDDERPADPAEAWREHVDRALREHVDVDEPSAEDGRDRAADTGVSKHPMQPPAAESGEGSDETAGEEGVRA